MNEITIDDITVKLSKKQRIFFEFLVDQGFFRELAEHHYVSLTPGRANSLNSIFSSSSESKNVSVFQLRPEASEYLISMLSGSFDSVVAHFVFRTYFELDNQSINQKITDTLERAQARDSRTTVREGRESARGEEPSRKKQQSRKKVSVEVSTEGSEFAELDRNELLSLENTVKPKINTPNKSKAKKIDIDTDLEMLANEWSSWATGKMPWLKDKLTPSRCYISFQKIKKVVNIDGEPITTQGLRHLFMFITKDKFWKDQAVSPNSLLTVSKNGVRKIDNILLRAKTKIEKINPHVGIDLEKRPF